MNINNDVNRPFYEVVNPPSKASSSKPIQFKEIVQDGPIVKKSWHERAIAHLNDQELQLDERLPNYAFQNTLDQLGCDIENTFAPLKEFNNWLDTNGHGKWYKQLATFLVKLPPRAVRNIIRLLYNFVKGALFAIVHPLKGINHLAILLISLIHELTKEETWSKIGIGMMGAGLGQALITGNPLSIIGLGIGASLLVAGLSIGALKAAVHAEKGAKFEAVKKNLFFQLKQLPEVALTGFCMGLMIGTIQRVIYEHQMKTYLVSNYEEARQYADSFVKEHKLPQYTEVELESSGKIIIKWQGNDLYYMERTHPEFFPDPEYPRSIYYRIGVNMELQPGNGQMVTNMHDFWDGYTYAEKQSLESIGIEGRSYPLPPENINFSQYGALSGALIRKE